MKYAALILAILVSGCAQFDNRVVCTVSGDRVYMVSEYMRVGVTTRINDDDAKVIVKASCNKEKSQ